MPGQEESPATARKSEEILTNESSSSSSKKRPITNCSSHQSTKRPRRSSRLKRQPDQIYTDDKSDSEVEDENELEDYEPDETVINQSSSSQISSKRKRQNEMKWKSKVQELRAFKQLHGHANVPKSNKQLGQWVNKQRYEYRKRKDNKHSCMTNERIQTLESIGFDWVLNKGCPRYEANWRSKFEELCAYKQLHGHTCVPKSSDKQLSNWVKIQRREYRKLKDNKKSQITNERIQTLDSIGFEWVAPNQGPPRNESQWNERFTELKAYKEKYGRTDVPRDFKDNKELGVWVSKQRPQYKKFQENKKSSMTPERINMLNSIGFQWECRSARAPRS